MAGLPINFAVPGEAAIVSYNWTDLASGLGYASFYPSLAISTDGLVSPVIVDKPFPSTTTTGLMAQGYSYEFISPPFKKAQSLTGDAFISGYIDYTSGGAINFSCKLQKWAGTPVSGGASATTYESLADVNVGYPSAVNWSMDKTLNVGDFVYSVAVKHKRTTVDNISSEVYFKLFFYGGDISIQTPTFSNKTNDYVTSTYINTSYATRKVYKVEVWHRVDANAPGYGRTLKDLIVTAATMQGLTITDITGTVSTSSAVDSSFLLKMPITDTTIGIGDLLVLTCTTSGGTGGIVLDPTNQIATKQSLEVNVPFKIEL